MHFGKRSSRLRPHDGALSGAEAGQFFGPFGAAVPPLPAALREGRPGRPGRPPLARVLAKRACRR